MGDVLWSPAVSSPQSQQQSLSGTGTTGNGTVNKGNGHGHKRSISIVSVSSLPGEEQVLSPKPRAKGHARASSLQITGRGGFWGPWTSKSLSVCYGLFGLKERDMLTVCSETPTFDFLANISQLSPRPLPPTPNH